MRAGGLALLASLALAAPAYALPDIHAHRGGSVQRGVPTFPENTLPAFHHAAARGFVLELDVKLTEDRVPVVIHDTTLDRTTNCTGPVRGITAAELRANCVVDVLGSGGTTATAGPGETAPVPTLAEVLDFARRKGARLNLEIKNLPTETVDFDPTPAFAERVTREIKASGLPLSQLIVQSFWPPNLDVAERDLPMAETSLLTLNQMNGGSPAFATARGYEWVSPQWPVDNVFVAEAHALERRIVVWTLNEPALVRAAAAVGVDAVITDDPYMARRALGG